MLYKENTCLFCILNLSCKSERWEPAVKKSAEWLWSGWLTPQHSEHIQMPIEQLTLACCAHLFPTPHSVMALW